MTTLVQAFNNVGQTWNGDQAFLSTLNPNLDLFFQAGASRGKNIDLLFRKAVESNEEVAVRILLWLRDAREGAGERQQFKNLVTKLPDAVIERIIPRIPELGRWDDLLVFLHTKHERQAAGLIANGLLSGNGLCAKWMPRNGVKANRLRYVLGVSPKAWRKCLVELTNVVETAMCSGNWEQIDFNKVPSVAAGRYIKAFTRHAPEQYEAYKAKLETGEAKVNAGAVYPYDVVKAARYGDKVVAAAQWKALPDFMEGVEDRILPIVDVSGSMGCPAGGYGSNSSVTCMDVAVGLGMYVAQRNVGAFQDVVMTFHETPQLVKLPKDFGKAVETTYRLPWGGSTDLERAFRAILDSALSHNVPAEEMPNKVLIVSDMQFNEACSGRNTFDAMRRMYEDSGYELPQVVFWNVNSSAGTIPVAPGTTGVALVSGFSPSVLKGVLKGNLDPVKVMLDTVMIDRYSY